MRLQQRRLSGDGERFREVAELQRHVNSRCRLYVDLNPLAYKTLETSQLDLEAVGPRHQIHESKGAIVGTDALAPLARGHIGQRDGGARDDSALGILDDA